MPTNVEYNNALVPDYPYSIGKAISDNVDLARPLGSWTGLDPRIGAPISGTLLGAGLGGLYAGGRYLWDKAVGNEREEEPWWKNPMVIGALGGMGLGAASGFTQHKTTDPRYDPLPAPSKAEPMKMGSWGGSVDPENIIRVIREDPSIADYEKMRLVGMVRQANTSQLPKLLAAAAAGTLTAATAHAILGTKFFGSAMLGGLAAWATNSMMSQRNPYF